MKKKILASLLAAATLSVGVFAGCSSAGQNPVGIKTIEKSNSVGLVDYYTITYTDGSVSTFTVTNGKDGENADALTVEQVYESYKLVYGEELSFADFCQKYLTVNTDNGAALNSCLRSCLKVNTVFREYQYNMFGYPVSVQQALYGGSAVIYGMDSEYTYLVTNYHVIYDEKAVATYGKYPEKIWAYMYGSESDPVYDQTSGSYTADDGYAIECEYIGGAINYDVAVLRVKTADITAINPSAAPVEITYDYGVGDNTYAIGNPDGAGISVTEGIVSVDSDYIALKIDSQARYYRSIRTDTALTNGSSGGGLFNMQGKLIGLNNAGDSEETSMNYAIPASILTGVADGVIHYYNLNGEKCSYLTATGATLSGENSRFILDKKTGGGHIEEDVILTEVSNGGLFGRSGLNVGDEITAITVNETRTEIMRSFQIDDLMLSVRVGDSVKVSYKRGGADASSESVTVQSSDLTKIS